MRVWQVLGLVSGTIITVVMALAAVSYSATLGSDEVAFVYLPLTNAALFSVMALAFDFGMIASSFGVIHWWSTRRLAACLCAVLFAIASLFSVHAVRGYVALNVIKQTAPAERSSDLYQSLKRDLDQMQAQLGAMRASYGGASRRDKRRLDAKISDLARAVDDRRSRLVGVERITSVSPIAGAEWGVALMLWFFNATCWIAWFAPFRTQSSIEHDSVARWLRGYDLSEPEHCATLYENYAGWCDGNECAPLARYSFYARLIELGARKFRDGRDGPTMYQLSSVSARS